MAATGRPHGPDPPANFTAQASGVDTNLLGQPRKPVYDGLRIEDMARVVIAHLLGARRSVIHCLRILREYGSVEPSDLKEQRRWRRAWNESNRLDGRHVPEPGGACCTGQGGQV